MTTGKVDGAIELWVQTADTSNTPFIETLTDQNFVDAEKNCMNVTSPPAGATHNEISSGKGNYLYPVAGGDFDAAIIAENKLLQDELSRGSILTRRLIVRNTSADLTVGFRVSFENLVAGGTSVAADATGDATLNPIDSLSEALRINTYLVSDNAADLVLSTSAVDGRELKDRAINGRIDPSTYTAYEMSFEYAATASAAYDKANYQVDLSLVAFGSFNNTHYVKDADELNDLLDDTVEPILQDGDTVIICDDFIADPIITDKVFNLNLEGHTLTVDGPFVIDRPDAKSLATMDIGTQEDRTTNGGPTYTGGGALIVKGGVASIDGVEKTDLKFHINAPGVAIRWLAETNADGSYPLDADGQMTGANGTTVPNIGKPAAAPDPVTYSTDLNVRSFNGINTDQVKNPSLGTVSLKDSSESLATSYNDITAAAKLNGSGTIEDPFTISSIAEYKYFEQQVNSGNTYENQFVKLMRNLDFHHMTNVLPIGGNVPKYDTPAQKSFKGTFDGNGKILLNLDIKTNDKSVIGVFGRVNYATIKNLGRVGGETTAAVTSPSVFLNWVGGLIGRADAGTYIYNCYNTANISGGGQTGGIVGSGEAAIVNCYNTGIITKITNTQAGGIVGNLVSGKIVSCYNTGKINDLVNMNNTLSGGIAGIITGGEIKNCFNTGEISGTGTHGGITGSVEINTVTLDSCYTVSQVANTTNSGAIIGKTISSLIVNNCYALSGIAGSQTKLFGNKTDAEIELDPQFTNVAWKDSAYMQSTQFIADLNGSTLPYAWKAPRQTAGYQYPWLRWQMKDIDTVYVSDFGYRSWNDIDITSTSFEESGADASNAILIETPEDYKKLAEDVKSGTTYSGTYFKLANNLDFNNISDIISIGGSTPNIRELPFAGIFDGNNKILFNVTIHSDAAHAVGIFGYCTGTIQNLGRIGGVINAPNSQSVGGIVGRTQFGSVIQNCYNTGAVYGRKEVGGVVGVFAPQSSNLTSCYNSGYIHAQSEVGGITGGVYSQVSDCYNVGNVVSETDFAGGISGKLNQLPPASITTCYNAGVVTAQAISGGVFGGIRYNSGGSCTATNNYALEGTAPQAVGDFDDAFDASTCYMKDKAFMTDGSLLTAFQTAGSTAWKAGPNGYPILTWQN